MKPEPKAMIQKKIDALNIRLDRAEPVSRLIVRVQFEQLAKAEKLRRLAVALVRTKTDSLTSIHRSSVSSEALRQLDAILKDLLPFHKPAKIPAAVRTFMKA